MKSTLTIATLAAITLIGASTLPALASKNTGAFQQSIEANHFLQQACTDYKTIFQSNLMDMNAAPKGSAAYKKAREAANDILGTAWQAGCSWAQ